MISERLVVELLITVEQTTSRPSVQARLLTDRCLSDTAVVSAGGRFKKEIVVDGQSHLLLIRDEGGPPEVQVSTAPALGRLSASKTDSRLQL